MSPEYVHSPNANKRRRLSVEDEQMKERARQVPRLYYSPERVPSRQLSPSLPTRPAAQDSWASSARTTTPFIPNGTPPAPTPVEMKDRMDARPALTGLPPPRSLDREAVPAHRITAPADLYQTSRPPNAPSSIPPVEAATSTYRDPSYPYPYHHPTRYQSLSASSAHPFDRTPFTTSGYNTPYQDFVRYGDLGPSGLAGDNKQRKRRGNLPKETTDKLRAWFVAHLQHPYPTEDEKQELMRQTGLQMSKLGSFPNMFWNLQANRRIRPNFKLVHQRSTPPTANNDQQRSCRV